MVNLNGFALLKDVDLGPNGCSVYLLRSEADGLFGYRLSKFLSDPVSGDYATLWGEGILDGGDFDSELRIMTCIPSLPPDPSDPSGRVFGFVDPRRYFTEMSPNMGLPKLLILGKERIDLDQLEANLTSQSWRLVFSWPHVIFNAYSIKAREFFLAQKHHGAVWKNQIAFILALVDFIHGLIVPMVVLRVAEIGMERGAGHLSRREFEEAVEIMLHLTATEHGDVWFAFESLEGDNMKGLADHGLGPLVETARKAMSEHIPAYKEFKAWCAVLGIDLVTASGLAMSLFVAPEGVQDSANSHRAEAERRISVVIDLLMARAGEASN